MSNSTSISDDLLFNYCSSFKAPRLLSTGLIVVKTLLVVPLSLFVLHLSHQQWRQQRSFRSASHSDVFTFHLSLIEVFWALGFICLLCGMYTLNLSVMMLGLSCCSCMFFGQMMIHTLTCVERYLAVVHPVVYLMFRNARGVRIRTISLCCVWLLSSSLTGFQYLLKGEHELILALCFMVVSIVVMTFCSLSVLWVLTRPGPGEGGRVDQSKLRAFHTITAISSVLWLWFVAVLLCFLLVQSPLLSVNTSCELMAGLNWFGLPSSLVSPLFYLHRARKVSSKP